MTTTEMRRGNGWVVTLARRICYAVTIGVVTWFLADRGGWQVRVIAMVLDFPVALSGAISGELRSLKGIDLFFGRGVGEFMSRETVLLWHLRASLLVYVPLFYVPRLISGGIGIIRRRKPGPNVVGASPESANSAT